MVKGIIVKAIAGFYYVDTGVDVIECKARGKFRNKSLSPLAGDKVEISVDENSVGTIESVEKFTGARVSAPDLRAGAALVIAGLAAEGVTIVDDIQYILRGYEDLEGKLASLGAKIEKVTTEKDLQKFILKVS